MTRVFFPCHYTQTFLSSPVSASKVFINTHVGETDDMAWLEDLFDLYFGLVLVPAVTGLVLMLGVLVLCAVFGPGVDRNVRFRGV